MKRDVVLIGGNRHNLLKHGHSSRLGHRKWDFFSLNQYSTVHTKTKREGIESSRILGVGTANKRKVCKHCIIYKDGYSSFSYDTTIRRPERVSLSRFLLRGTNMFALLSRQKHFSMHVIFHLSDSVRRLFLVCSRDGHELVLAVAAGIWSPATVSHFARFGSKLQHSAWILMEHSFSSLERHNLDSDLRIRMGHDTTDIPSTSIGFTSSASTPLSHALCETLVPGHSFDSSSRFGRRSHPEQSQSKYAWKVSW
jgi:hypothetical protein